MYNYTSFMVMFSTKGFRIAPYRAVALTSQGAWLPLILMLQSWNFFMVILEAQVTQICSMNVLRLITDFIKMSKVWFLSMEFYGVWQEVAEWLTWKVRFKRRRNWLDYRAGEFKVYNSSYNLLTLAVRSQATPTWSHSRATYARSYSFRRCLGTSG